MVSETPVEQMLGELGPGDRIYALSVYDPQLEMEIGAITVIRGTHLSRIDEICAQTEDPFHVALKKAAYTQVCIQLWGGKPPDGAELRHAFEVSPRELRTVMDAEMERRSAQETSTS